MSPAARFNALLSSVVVFAMLAAIVGLAPFLQSLPLPYQIATPFIGFLTSAGAYRLLGLGLRWLMDRSTWTKRKVLGENFLHGTWVGWFHGHAGDVRFTVEHFTQDLDSLVITGRSFTSTRLAHGQWESDVATVDGRRGRLSFTYKMDVLSRSTSLVGINTSLLDRPSPHAPASAISGFAHDLNDNFRSPFQSLKVSDELLSWDVALSACLARYAKVAPAPATAGGA